MCTYVIPIFILIGNTTGKHGQINLHPQSAAFSTLICVKLAVTHHSLVNICCTECIKIG